MTAIASPIPLGNAAQAEKASPMEKALCIEGFKSMETLYQSGNIIRSRYRIVAPLGQGAFGTTYEAEDLTNYQRIAIKALSLHEIKDWKVLELLEREAKVLKNLKHPAIPKYLGYFRPDTEKDCHFYLVQELVAGESLAALVEKGWYPDESEVKRIANQVLQILSYLHQLTPPVIHRDINPHNLIRHSDGRVFLVDFGAVQEVYRNTLTRGGTFVGMLGYMPPEQFSGSVKPASDLYSLGATLLFLLMKRSPAELSQRRMKMDFRRRVQISPQFADWLEKMLEPAIEDRFQSATDALKALQDKQVLRSVLMPKPEQPTVSKDQQSKGRRIFLRKSDRRLVMEIPPTGWIGAMSVAFVSSLIGIFIGSLLWNAVFVVKAFHPLLFIFILIFLASSVACAIGVLWLLAGRTRMEIDKQNFRLQSTLWDWTVNQVRGQTENIERVELDVQLGSNKVSTACLIWYGVQRCRISTGNRAEDEWLVGELANFLAKLGHEERSSSSPQRGLFL